MCSASSPLVLSLATIFALLGIVLVAIALGTNDWQLFKVDQSELSRLLSAESANKDEFEKFILKGNNKRLRYTRTYGLFRECFPDPDVPQGSFSGFPLFSVFLSVSVAVLWIQELISNAEDSFFVISSP